MHTAERVKCGKNKGVARKVPISEAAQLIGAQESVIRDWIQKGLLPSLRREYYPSLPQGTLGILYR